MRNTRLSPRLLAGAVVLAGCSRSSAPSSSQGEHEELRHEGVVGQVSFPELAEDLGYLGPVKLTFVGNTISGPQDIQTVVTGDTDYGMAFDGAIIKLIAAKAPIRAVVASYGIDEKTFTGFYVPENSPIHTARDLIGKKVSMNTLGAHHESVLRDYLDRAGLTPEEIEKVTMIVVPPMSSDPSLRGGQVDVAAMYGVLREKALEHAGLRLLFSDVQMYGPFNAGSYVFRTKFIEQNPKTVARFVDGTARAIEWARGAPPDEVVARFREIIGKRGRNEDATLVTYWRSVGLGSRGGLVRDADLQRWIDWLVRAGELRSGEVTPAQVETNEFNPFANAPAVAARP